VGAHSLSGTLSRRGLNPIKLAYNPSRQSLTVNGFNGLGQCVSSPGNRAYCYAKLAVSSLSVADHAYPWRDGQAE